MNEIRIISPTGILGYGFPEESFREGLRRRPHLIAVDAGSTDPGPYYLGAGVSFTNRAAVKRDLALMLDGALQAGIPMIVGSAGGSGGAPHLAWTLEIVRELARERQWSFKMAAIAAEISRETAARAFAQGRIMPLRPAPELTGAELDRTVRIVGQMGIEPFVRALDDGAQVIIAGRAYDPAVFAALPVRAGFDQGLAVHLGKILECACIAATPGSGNDCMLGVLRRDCFTVEPLNPQRACTTLSVAAHTLYEKTNPYELPGPGGILDLRAARFDQETDRVVRVSGSRFQAARPYRVKLEGAKLVGYRTVSIAGARDPVMIRELDTVIAGVRARVADNLRGVLDQYYLDFKVYGRNGVMGALEPHPAAAGHELGIVIEAVAGDQDSANAVCSLARSTMLHYGYPGRIATAGNLAFPYSPSDFKAGAVYAFSVYHLLEVDDPLELFPIRHETLGGGT